MSSNAALVRMFRDANATATRMVKMNQHQQHILGLYDCVVELAATEGVDPVILREEAKQAIERVAQYITDYSGDK